jgi:hypothetical protein
MEERACSSIKARSRSASSKWRSQFDVHRVSMTSRSALPDALRVLSRTRGSSVCELVLVPMVDRPLPRVVGAQHVRTSRAARRVNLALGPPNVQLPEKVPATFRPEYRFEGKSDGD